jgi:hypothetical protein
MAPQRTDQTGHPACGVRTGPALRSGKRRPCPPDWDGDRSTTRPIALIPPPPSADLPDAGVRRCHHRFGEAMDARPRISRPALCVTVSIPDMRPAMMGTFVVSSSGIASPDFTRMAVPRSRAAWARYGRRQRVRDGVAAQPVLRPPDWRRKGRMTEIGTDVCVAGEWTGRLLLEVPQPMVLRTLTDAGAVHPRISSWFVRPPRQTCCGPAER